MNEPLALTAATLVQVCTKASSAISQLYDHTCNRLRHVSAFMNTNCPAGSRREHPIFSQVWNLGSPLCSRDTSAPNDTQAVMNRPFRPFTPGHQHPGKKPYALIQGSSYPNDDEYFTSHTPPLLCRHKMVWNASSSQINLPPRRRKPRLKTKYFCSRRNNSWILSQNDCLIGQTPPTTLHGYCLCQSLPEPDIDGAWSLTYQALSTCQ